MEQLTTPEMKQQDVVFPGENWFFYWKTSPSLWEAKLRDFKGPSPLFVPIYWSLHSEYSDKFDFGQNKPETDLARLAKLALKQGIDLVFFLAIGPVPFQINGGVPSYLARNLSQNRDRLAMGVLDNSQRVNKIYSFFDPKVFQAYRKFAYNIGQYFSQLGIEFPVMGLDSMRLEGEHLISFFKDDSPVFEAGFSRYLSQLEVSDPDKIENIKKDPEFLKSLKEDYFKLIQNLYKDAAKESLGGHWNGILEVCLLGAGTKDIFKRLVDNWNQEKDYFKPLFLSIAKGIYPSSVLLDFNLKEKSLGRALTDVVTTPLVQRFLSSNTYGDELTHAFSQLFFFELFNANSGYFNIDQALDQSGLKYYFEKEFPNSIKFSNLIPTDFDELDPRRIHFFFGSRIDNTNFSQILKLFLSGMKVFIDVDELDERIADKLEVFFVENNIQTEKINYISPITKASLGEGLIITFDSSKLRETSLVKRAGFWDTIMDYMDIKHLEINVDEDIEYFWKARSSNTYELNYEEIRRVSFYNPTSYRRKALIKTSKNFAFIKHLDQFHSDLKSTPIGIELSLLPGGSITLDFGFFDI